MRRIAMRLQGFVRGAGTLLVCLSLTMVAASGEESPRPGLMWNRTGLPLVFPLQVKTPSGKDYFLTLIDAQSGDEALGAYIEGGEYFRILVPPGTFTLRFAAGETWQGEEELFGPGPLTRSFEMPRPLTFEIRDFATKRGHLVDITTFPPDESIEARISNRHICQELRLDVPPLGLRLYDERFRRRAGIPNLHESGPLIFPAPENPLTDPLTDQQLRRDGPDPRSRYPRYVVRTRFC
ncbi:hypothetical protein ACFSUD_06010 [Sulfitobacter aestuarii]|uniref:Uncharacterized protein n=1 Tax=Sulfitobacter aestuarii TaxID=2161676 RepID=A0ABW5TZN0_9RHOB